MSSPTRRTRVAVLYNRDAGSPDVTDVERAAGDVMASLTAGGYLAEPVPVDGVHALVAAIDRLAAERVDLVFNLCEAVGGQAAHEPLVAHLLELADLTYTGSPPLALALALRKDRARAVLAAAGVPIAAGVALDHPPRGPLPLAYPLIVKLAARDGSVENDRGSVVADARALGRRVRALLEEHGGPILVEEHIAGRELSVSLVGPDPTALPVRATGLGPLRTQLLQLARRAFLALGLRDYASVDFRVDEQGRPFVIDVNPNCDLSADAAMARAAGFAKWTHAELVDRICRAALQRRGPYAPKEPR